MTKEALYCSFCGKSQDEVSNLIAGPCVFICNECVDLCKEIIEDERETNAKYIYSLLGCLIHDYEGARIRS